MPTSAGANELYSGQGLHGFQSVHRQHCGGSHTERPTDSTDLVKLIARGSLLGATCTHPIVPDRIDWTLGAAGITPTAERAHSFLSGKARGEAKRKKLYSTYCGERAEFANVCCAIWNASPEVEGRSIWLPVDVKWPEEALCLIADDLAAVELAANVCDRRIMEQEKVPMAEKIISLSDSDASFSLKEDGTPW